MTRILKIENPKRYAKKNSGRESWYSYYAGFSHQFVRSVLSGIQLPEDPLILDPWNGAGTTTSVAARQGFRSVGIDLNPSMGIIAKAKLLNSLEQPSLIPLLADILKKARTIQVTVERSDPLTCWLVPNSVRSIRQIEKAIQVLLLPNEYHGYLCKTNTLEPLSDLLCFFYTSLFKVVRRLLKSFVPSNPTWIKRPKSLKNRLRPSDTEILHLFESFAIEMADELLLEESTRKVLVPPASLLIGSSEEIPLGDGTIDHVLSSPPYCTRIDYAMATMPELALLGFRPNSDFGRLRRQMIGTSTVPKEVEGNISEWGSTCASFMMALRKHESKASSTYYFKNHMNYFSRMFRSLRELSRVVKPGGYSTLVVQDSYYKDVHNDLPAIVEEMLMGFGFLPRRRFDYPSRILMANLNSASKRYVRPKVANERVIIMRKS